MIQRFRVFGLLAGAGITCIDAVRATAQTTRGQSASDHTSWVAQVLTQMLEIKPGMTRETLLTIFTTEGGLSTRLRQTFVSRDCPYFKVDVDFQAAGDEEARATLVEDGRDLIGTVSRPYLQFTIAD
jgi:hypothetical protein